MRRFTLAAAVTIFVTALAAPFNILVAEEGQAKEPRQEYIPTTAQTTEILRDELAVIAGKEANIRAVAFPPGWVGERHYHTGDVFIYVQQGKFVVDVEGEGRKTFGPGEVYHEAVNTVMQARNGARGKTTRFLLFQIGDKGEPLMIKAK